MLSINNKLNLLIAILIIIIVASLMIHRILFNDELTIDSQMMLQGKTEPVSQNSNSDSSEEISESSEMAQ